MMCPVCVAHGQRSKVTPLGGTVTLMASRPWYDEEGVYHRHDPNAHVMQFSCSNDHAWRETSHWSCPSGDYGGEKPIVTIYEPSVKACR